MTAFTTWSHRIADGLSQRTLPTRLSDMQNVKDFGAIGNGSNNDTTNIQAAIDYAATKGVSGEKGSTVFFPSGAYKITAPLKNDNANTSIHLMGVGRANTRLEGTTMTSGYVIDTSGAAGKIEEISGMQVSGFGDGAVRMSGTDGATLRNMILGGLAGLDASNSNNITCYNIQCGTGAANTGYYTGDNMSLINCNGMGLACAVQACGTGLLMMGCRTETNTLSLCLGKDRTGAVSPLNNFTILSHTTERNRTAIEFHSAHNGFFGGGIWQGTHGITQNYVHAASWSAGKVTITSGSALVNGAPSGSPTAHGMSVGMGVKIDTVGTGYNGWFIITDVPTSTTFKYAVVSDPGAASVVSGTSTWTELQYNGVSIPASGRVSNVMIAGVNLNMAPYIACWNLTNMNVADSLTLIGIASNTVGGGNTLGTKIIYPTTPCPGLRIFDGGDLGPAPIGTFANLPTAVEGQEYSVTDANTSGKTWGDAITAGGSSTHALLHRNATGWTLEGI